MSKFSKKPLALALGAAFTLTGMAAHASVFQASDLSASYMVASAEDKGKEGKCGEAKCGAACLKEKMEMGKMTEADAKAMCDKMAHEGKCGGDKPKKKEGKCGEGKCGGKK